MSVAEVRAYRPEVYEPHLLQTWLEIADRQSAKDRILMPSMAAHFVPGRILELGAGVGQLSQLLIEMGKTVVPSDFAAFFVEHMRSRGLQAHQVDATNIAAAKLGQFENVFCQSITPFITTDYDVVESAYRSVFETLRPNGRLVLIHAMERRSKLPATIKKHIALCEAQGFVNVQVTRQQALPSALYERPMGPMAALIERLVAPTLGMRFYLTATRP